MLNYKPVSVCPGEIDGTLDIFQTEPRLIPLSLLAVGSCEKRQCFQGCGITCALADLGEYVCVFTVDRTLVNQMFFMYPLL